VQNKYVGDVGDYCKLGLLRWLCGMHPDTGDTQLSLGVGWYAVPDDFDPPSNRDGRHISYLGLDHDENNNIIQTPGTELLKCLDADLWSQLRNAVGNLKNQKRHISTLESILKASGNCAFHGTPLPGSSNWRDRSELRQVWANKMVQGLHSRDLIFLDPDNGLASEKMRTGARKIAKHILFDELLQLIQTAKIGLIFYHHLGQHEPHPTQIAKLNVRLNCLKQHWKINSLVFNRNTCRAFFVLIRKDHKYSGLLKERLDSFIHRWRRPEGAVALT
jgi:hypothetical protein